MSFGTAKWSAPPNSVISAFPPAFFNATTNAFEDCGLTIVSFAPTNARTGTFLSAFTFCSFRVTLPESGAIDGAMILGEIGNIHRFASPAKLLAYAGLDPTVCQSGKFKARSTKMSKRGSKMLRFALINSAWQLTLKNDTFFNYYQLKLSQGLSHYGALGHVAHKLVRVIFTLLKHNVLFVPTRLV